MNNVEKLISEQEILKKVEEIGKKITDDFKDESVTIVSVLKGSFIFTADLVRFIKSPVEIAFIAASSYGASTVSSGELKIRYDIEDTGLTISRLKEYLYELGAKDVKICTIFDKPDRREKQVTIDYCGFVIPNEFVVGYGLDYNNKYRNLRNLCKITI